MTESFVSRRVVASGRVALSIKGGWSDAAESEIRKGGFDYLEIGPGDWGDYDFLSPFVDNITHVKVLGVREGTRGLERLKRLEGLGLSLDATSANVPSLLAFPRLKGCSFFWNKRFGPELPCLSELSSMAVFGFSEKNCETFGQVSGLRKLSLTKGGVESLQGIERLQHLEELELAYLKKLNDISSLASLKGLKKLSLDNAPGVHGLSVVGDLVGLEELYLFGCGGFSGLHWVGELRSARKLWISVPVEVMSWDDVMSLPLLKMLTVWPPKEQAVGERELKEISAMHGKLMNKFTIGGTRKAPIYMLGFD